MASKYKIQEKLVQTIQLADLLLTEGSLVSGKYWKEPMLKCILSVRIREISLQRLRINKDFCFIELKNVVKLAHEKTVANILLLVLCSPPSFSFFDPLSRPHKLKNLPLIFSMSRHEKYWHLSTRSRRSC